MAEYERGHKNDIVVGMGTICWNQYKKLWVLPGKNECFDAREAKKAASWINDQFIKSGAKPATWSK